MFVLKKSLLDLLFSFWWVECKHNNCKAVSRIKHVQDIQVTQISLSMWSGDWENIPLLKVGCTFQLQVFAFWKFQILEASPGKPENQSDTQVWLYSWVVLKHLTWYEIYGICENPFSLLWTFFLWAQLFLFYPNN